MTPVDWTKAAEFHPDELARLLDEDHDEVDDNPPASDEQLAAAVPGKRRPGQRGPGKRQSRVQVTLRLNREAVEAFKATGPGWQTRMNMVLEEASHRIRKLAGAND